MKRILLSVAVLTLTSAVFAQKKVADVAKFNTETIEMGKLKQGTPTKGTFIVTNIGKEPLIIEQANPTCGCTISDYTKEPIAPGKTGVINATYNAANAGHFDKHLTVKFAGVDEVKSITLTGDVVASAAPAPEKVNADAEVKPAVVAVPAVASTVSPAPAVTPAKVKSKTKSKAKKAATTK